MESGRLPAALKRPPIGAELLALKLGADRASACRRGGVPQVLLLVFDMNASEPCMAAFVTEICVPLALDPFGVETVPIGVETDIPMPKGAGVGIGVGIVPIGFETAPICIGTAPVVIGIGAEPSHGH